jgi:hypothetical protein
MLLRGIGDRHAGSMSSELVTFGAAAVGSLAGLGGALIVNFGQRRLARDQLRDQVYAAFLGSITHMSLVVKGPEKAETTAWLAAMKVMQGAQAQLDLISDEKVGVAASLLANHVTSDDYFHTQTVDAMQVLYDKCVNAMREEARRMPMKSLKEILSG